MKRFFQTTGVLLAGLLVSLPVAAKSPYTAASEVDGGSVDAVVSDVKSALRGAGFEVVGSYHPAGQDNMVAVAATDEGIIDAIKKRPVTSRGGHTIAGAALRVGVFNPKDGPIEVSFANPTYQYAAYFQDAYPDVRSEAQAVEERLMEALGGVGDKVGESFGGNVSMGDLAHYHYMIFMPYMEDDHELASYADFQTGVQTVRANLGKGVAQTESVYEVVLPDRKLAVFGVAMKDPNHGEPSWFPKLIQRHVAAMPYEIYVVGDKAYTLHGRFRIALSWPTLTMATFSNIMDAPPDTEEIMRQVASPE
ncbi:MAG TPA: hypothetical protein VJ985_02805 [Gammaproteobacteria bacterium]|nr:hypothetical protein [Gammaproteobacteria bacterium]